MHCAGHHHTPVQFFLIKNNYAMYVHHIYFSQLSTNNLNQNHPQLSANDSTDKVKCIVTGASIYFVSYTVITMAFGHDIVQ